MFLEDVRQDSQTKGDQFEIVEAERGVATLRKLTDEERVKPDQVFSRIIDRLCNRQIGDRPKIMATHRFNPDLLEALRERAKSENRPVIDLLEEAIALYLN